jgi:hypothetical protein
MKGTGGIVFDAVWYSGVAVFTGGAAYFGGSAIGGVGGVGGVGSDAKPGGGGIGTIAQRALNVANVVEAGKKVLSPTPPPKVPGVPPVPNSGSRATGGQSAPKGVHPNPAAPGGQEGSGPLTFPHFPKDTSGWLAGDGAGGPGTPYLPDRARKPPGWSEDWPEGVDERGPYSEDPSGTRWHPHPEDGRHWDHYDNSRGERYPERSKKLRPDQRRMYPGYSRTDPWSPPDVMKPMRITLPSIPQGAANSAAAGVTTAGVLIFLGILLLPLGI